MCPRKGGIATKAAGAAAGVAVAPTCFDGCLGVGCDSSDIVALQCAVHVVLPHHIGLTAGIPGSK